ncbi:MAG: hypothetical protein HY060_04680 [Proteobacteria bacterium]|nr:hypothetical protein [Pseudomonadota bacterium]
MKFLASAAVLVLGGALAGCVEQPWMGYDETPPAAVYYQPVAAVYRTQLGCADCREHRHAANSAHRGHHEAKNSKHAKRHGDERR